MLGLWFLVCLKHSVQPSSRFKWFHVCILHYWRGPDGFHKSHKNFKPHFWAGCPPKCKPVLIQCVWVDKTHSAVSQRCTASQGRFHWQSCKVARMQSAVPLLRILPVTQTCSRSQMTTNGTLMLVEGPKRSQHLLWSPQRCRKMLVAESPQNNESSIAQ